MKATFIYTFLPVMISNNQVLGKLPAIYHPRLSFSVGAMEVTDGSLEHRKANSYRELSTTVIITVCFSVGGFA